MAGAPWFCLEERPDLPIARFRITHILANLHQQLDSTVLLDDAIHFKDVGGFAVVQFTTTTEQFINNCRLQHPAAVSPGKTALPAASPVSMAWIFSWRWSVALHFKRSAKRRTILVDKCRKNLISSTEDITRVRQGLFCHFAVLLISVSQSRLAGEGK